MYSKRVFDFVVSGVLLFLLSPVLLGIGLWIWLDAGRPILFKQVRTGQYGKPFTILKFRTMYPNASEGLSLGASDPRISRTGLILRKTKLDELPQLWNVLRGEMSLVGPRPDLPQYTALLDERQREIFALKPGITDWASIHYHNEEEILAAQPEPEAYYIKVILPHKVELNRRYLSRPTRLHDMQILWASLRRIFF